MSTLSTLHHGYSSQPGGIYNDLYEFVVLKAREEIRQNNQQKDNVVEKTIVKKHVAPVVESVNLSINNCQNSATIDLADHEELATMATELLDGIQSGTFQSQSNLLGRFLFGIINLSLDEILEQLKFATPENIDEITIPFNIPIDELDQIITPNDAEHSSVEEFKMTSEVIAIVLKMKEVLEFRDFVKSGVEYDEDSAEYKRFLTELAVDTLQEPQSEYFTSSSISDIRKHILNDL
jgi:hypothetical protein